MKNFKSYKEYIEALEGEGLLERRSVPTPLRKKAKAEFTEMDEDTIRRILKRTSYTPGESCYLYNVLSFLMAKRL